jgi:hypothetical protein
MSPTQPPVLWLPEEKPPWLGTDHSPPSSAKVNMKWIFTTTLPYAFIVWCLNSERNKNKEKISIDIYI